MRQALMVAVLLGCSSGSAPHVPPPAAETPEAETAEAAPAGAAPEATPETPVPGTDGVASLPAGDGVAPGDDVGQALAAYRALVRAFNGHDETAYFGAFADTLDCFYGRASVPVSHLRESRLGPDEHGFLSVFRLDVLARRDGEVALLDRGLFAEGVGTARQVMHEKIVVLRRIDGVFRVVAETGRTGASCLPASLGLEIEPSPFFDRCRTAHGRCLGDCACARDGDERGCGDCLDECESTAIACLGSPRRPTTAAASTVAPPPGGRVLATDADVRRFVELATGELSVLLGGEPPEPSDEDVEWLALASAETGRPRFQWVDESQSLGCDGYPIPPSVVEAIGDVIVDDVRCSSDRSRCVVWVTGYEPDRTTSTVVHLFFDGPRLRARFVEPFGPQATPDPAALERFAIARPPTWNGPCQSALEGLLEDRAGEDFFRITDDVGDQEGDAAFRAERLCGSAAREGVVAAGDDWSCLGRECTVWYPCGNWCEYVTADRSGAIRAHSDGIDALPYDEERLAALRRAIPCGEARFLDIAGELLAE